jgi:RNA polymerase sigma-70 factor (ECF subfamily)
MMTQMMFCKTHLLSLSKSKKIQRRKQTFWMYRIATNEALTFKKKKSEKAEVSSETLQNKVIDNLKSDSYFDGNEIQIKLHKAL